MRAPYMHVLIATLAAAVLAPAAAGAQNAGTTATLPRTALTKFATKDSFEVGWTTARDISRWIPTSLTSAHRSCGQTLLLTTIGETCWGIHARQHGYRSRVRVNDIPLALAVDPFTRGSYFARDRYATKRIHISH